MKVRPNQPSGTIQLAIRTEFSESELIPKQLQLLDEDQNIVLEKWISRAMETLSKVKAGKYILRLRMPSGIIRSKVVLVSANEQTYVDMDLLGISPHEDMEWAYFSNKNVSRQPVNDKAEIAFPFTLDIRFLRSIQGNMVPDPGLNYLIASPVTIRVEDGLTLGFRSPADLTALEIKYTGYPRKTVSLPPESEVKVLLRPVLNREERKINPLEVIVSTSNWKAEALLSLLKTGAIHDAQTLITYKQAGELVAEELLQQKRLDRAAATIGGYYLLRSNCLKRLHDWPKNLADWFPQLPDGAIIYATQLLNNKKPRKVKMQESRKYFIEALKRGLPVYTEGFRLLVDGVTQLYYHSKKQDARLGTILDNLKKYQKRIDWSQSITTLNELFLDVEDEPKTKARLTVPAKKQTHPTKHTGQVNKKVRRSPAYA
jgi:hypothetical protein